MEFGQDAANNVLVILGSAVGWWLVRNWKGSSSQLRAQTELWLRGFSLTTTFGDNGAFLRGLPFNYWYHQLLLGFWSYSDTVTGVTAAEKSNWVSEILFPMDLNIEHLKMELLRGSLDRGRGFPRDFLLKQNEKRPLCWLDGMYTTELFGWFFFKCLLQMQFPDLGPHPWLCKADRGGFHINMCLSIKSRDRKLLKFSQPC